MPPSSHDGARARGVMLVLLAGVVWSSAGLIVRGLEAAEGWQIVFYRSLGLTLALLATIAVTSRGRMVAAFRAAGIPGVLGGLCLALCFSSYVFALLNTTVASVVFIMSASPLTAAVLGWIVLGERVRPATWLACFIALAGVGTMVAGSLDGGGLVGMLFALVVQAGFAGFTVALRSRPGVDMYPTVCWSGIFALVASGILVAAGGQGFDIGSFDIGVWDTSLCLFFGIGQLAFGMILYTWGARVLGAAELTLLSLSEVVLNPIWVWLAFDEVPASSTLLGGSVVLAALAFQALSGMRRERPPIGLT